MKNILIDDIEWNSYVKEMDIFSGKIKPEGEYTKSQMMSDLDKIGEEEYMNPNSTFFDCSAGIGTFPRELYKRLIRYHSHDHIMNNMIYVAEISKFLTNRFLEPIMGLKNIYKGDFITMGKIKGWPDKFTYGIYNPPFDKSLHLDFLNKMVDICEKRVITVEPCSFLIEKKGKHKPFINAKNKIRPYVDSLCFFNGNSKHGMFGIDLPVPCVILNLNLEKKDDSIYLENRVYNQNKVISVSQLDEISIFGHRELNTFSAKVTSYIKQNGSIHDRGSINKKREKPSNPNGYTLGMSRIMGHVASKNSPADAKFHGDDFYAFIKKGCINTCIRRSSSWIENGKGYDIWWEFETEDEAKNFRNILMLKPIRACLLISKFATALYAGELRFVPWIDVSRVWTEEEIYEELVVSDGEKRFINEMVPNYYL